MDIIQIRKRKVIILVVSLCLGIFAGVLTSCFSTFINPWLIGGFVFLFLVSFISFFALPDNL